MKATIAVLIGFALLAGAAAIAYWMNPWLIFRPQVNWTVEDVAKIIKAEVPKQAGQSAVKSVLDRHHIQHSTFDARPDDASTDISSAAKEAGLKSKDYRVCLRGQIVDAAVDFLFHQHIWMYFFFDEQDRLVGHWIDTQVIGL